MPGPRDDELKLPSYMTGGRKIAGSHTAAGEKKPGSASHRPSGRTNSGRSGGTTAERPKTPKQVISPAGGKAGVRSARAANLRYAPGKNTSRRYTAAEASPAPRRHRTEKPSPRAAYQENVPRRTKNKRVNYRRLFTVAAMLLTIIGAAAYGVGRLGENTSVIGTQQIMPEGVSVLGIDVGGLSKTAARKSIMQKADDILNRTSIVLNCGGDSFTLTAEDINLGYDIESTLQQALSCASQKHGNADASENIKDINGIFTWNSTVLRRAVENIADKFDTEPADAKADPVQNPDSTISFAVEPGKDGRRLDVDATVKDIEGMLGVGSFSFTLDGIVTELHPRVSEADLAGSFGLRGTYTTQYYVSTSDEVIKNRVFNIEKAAGIINGCMVAPGEEWSFNSYVGLRTYEGGWKGAKGIVYGKGHEIQAGGGICQVSTTLYNALLCSDVEVTDRRAHTIPSDYVAKGLDATVDSTGIDLKFKNDTGAPLFLFTHIDDVPDSKYDSITFEIYGKSLDPGVTYKTRSEVIDTIRRNEVNYTDDNTIPRGYKLVTLKARDGYKVEAYRDKYINGKMESSELLYTDSYRGNAEEARRGTASPKYYKPPKGAVKLK